MNCAFDKEKLTGFYDGELDAAEKAEVERHIAACSECLRDLGELKSAALLIKELPRLRAPRSLAEGVKREMQSAGKVHRFAAFRKNLMWVAATAAALLVVLNVAYFGSMSKSAESPTMAAQPSMKAAPVPVLADAAPRDADARKGAEDKSRFDEATRRASSEDRALGQKPLATEELRKNLAEGKAAESLGRGEAGPLKPTAPAEAPKPPGVPPPAPVTKPMPKPDAAAPAIAAAKVESPQPMPERAAEAKKDAGAFGKAEDLKAKKPVNADPAADAPVHYTLASVQMAKARPQVEATLRQLGVAVPAPAAATKAAAKEFAVPSPDAYTLEMTDSQIVRLRQEIEKQSYSKLVVAAPGDPALEPYGDARLNRAREKSVAAGGAAAPSSAPAPGVRKPAEMPKDEPAKEAQDLAKSGADKLEKEKAAEPRRKVVLHLLEVESIPEAPPAAEPARKK